MLLCRRNGSGFENLAEKFCFSLGIGLFLSERYNFVLFSANLGQHIMVSGAFSGCESFGRYMETGVYEI